MRNEKQARAELRRIAKMFRQHMKNDRKAAEKERRAGNDFSAARLEGEAESMEYAAGHVERVVSFLDWLPKKRPT